MENLAIFHQVRKTLAPFCTQARIYRYQRECMDIYAYNTQILQHMCIQSNEILMKVFKYFPHILYIFLISTSLLHNDE